MFRLEASKASLFLSLASRAFLARTRFYANENARSVFSSRGGGYAYPFTFRHFYGSYRVRKVSLYLRALRFAATAELYHCYFPLSVRHTAYSALPLRLIRIDSPRNPRERGALARLVDLARVRSSSLEKPRSRRTRKRCPAVPGWRKVKAQLDISSFSFSMDGKRE